MSIRTPTRAGDPTVSDHIGPLPGGFLTRTIPIRGAVVSAMLQPVVHVDRSTTAIMAEKHRLEEASGEEVSLLQHKTLHHASTGGFFRKKKTPPKPSPRLPTVKGSYVRVVFESERMDEAYAKDKDVAAYWKQLLYQELPDHALAHTLGHDMGFTIRITIIPNHYDPSRLTELGNTPASTRLHKYRVDIGGLTGGSQGKRLLDLLGNHFSDRIRGYRAKSANARISVVTEGKFYICTASDMSFYRIVGALGPGWDMSGGAQHFRNTMLSNVLLGTPQSPVQMATSDRPANLATQVFDMPLQFQDAQENKWIWTASEEADMAAITAVDPQSLVPIVPGVPVVEGLPVEQKEDAPPSNPYPVL